MLHSYSWSVAYHQVHATQMLLESGLNIILNDIKVQVCVLYRHSHSLCFEYSIHNLINR